MVTISFSQLEIYKKGKNDNRGRTSYELIMNFNVQPEPSKYQPPNLQYAIYDEQNNLITTLVLGKTSYPIGSNVYPSFMTTAKKITVLAWITGNQLIARYDIPELGTKGAQEYNKISNVTSKTLELIPTSPIIPPTAPATSPPPLEEVVAQQSTTQLQQQIQAPVAEPTPVGNLNPYQLTTTINPKWILLAVVGVGILSAIIFIMRRRA